MNNAKFFPSACFIMQFLLIPNPVQEQYEAALDREGSLTRDEKLKSKFDTLMGDGKKTIYRLLPKLPIFSIKSEEEVS